MLLKYSLNDIKRQRRLLDVSHTNVDVNEGVFTISVTTKTPHRLNINDGILLKHNIKTVSSYTEAVAYLSSNPLNIVIVEKRETVIEKDIKGDSVDVTYEAGYYWKNENKVSQIPQSILSSILNKYSSFNDKLIAVCGDDVCQFTVTIPRYQMIHVGLVTDTDSIGYFKTAGNLPLLLRKGDTLIMQRKSSYYKYSRGAELYDDFIEVNTNPNNSSEYLGGDVVIFGGNVYEWTSKMENIPCTYIDENTFSYNYDDCIVYENEVLQIEDRRFVSQLNTIYDTVLFYEYKEYINLNLPISNTNATELNDENLRKVYFDECKEKLIGKIIDYEKRCFEPRYKGIISQLIPINSIKFNLFLRDRSGSEEWNTSDDKGWNQCPMDDNGEFKANDYITNGDLLTYLRFTDEDVYYRRKKIEKTFLRLSFYSSDDPFSQMLLFYSTIFLDSGDLYTKYISNVKDAKGSLTDIVKQNIFGSNNLTLSFNVGDRYSRDKSSEGFYLYLFPDGLQNGVTRTIYMKAELHHAGTGKTVPLMYPCAKSKPLTFKNSNFPKHLLTDDGDLTKLYDYMFIPITLAYDATTNEYIYYFNVASYDSTNKAITIGLYEPKINPLT